MDIATNYANGDKTNTKFDQISFETVDQLKEIVKKDWTPSVCIDGRTLDHFVYTQFLFGDVDNDSQDESTHCTIEQFRERFKGKEFYIITSRNHQKDKAKQAKGEKWVSKATDRYHVLFPLEQDCYDLDWISKELDGLCQNYNFFDASAKGGTRFYFGCESEVYHEEGNKWPYSPVDAPEQNYEFDGKINPELDETLNKRILERILSAYNMGAFKSYGEWIKCGQALKGCGFTLDDWRLITDNNVSERMIQTKWNSFKGTKIGKGTLIEYARKSDPDFLRPGSIAKSKPSFNSKATNNSGTNGGGNGGGNPGTPSGPSSEHNPEKAFLDFYRRMDVDDFPDFSQTRKVTPTSNNQLVWVKSPKPTLRNLEVMLGKYGIVVRYNLMSHMPEIICPGINGEGNVQNASLGIIISLCKLNGLEIVGNISELLHVLTNKNKYHPVKEWIRSGNEKWDGKDRFEYLASCVVLNNFSEETFRMYLRKWLLSAYACLFAESYRGRGVLTLQGRQYQGKSAFFKHLMPKEHERSWFTEGLTLDPRNKDSISMAISHWISELGELEGTFKRSDISALKAFLTKESDIIRMPYDKREETYPRRSVYCASVNDSLFLADDTGSSRFWVVHVEFINLEKLEGFDSKQLWLQVKEWYNAGEKWWMSQAEDEGLQITNENFTESDPFEDRIQSYYDTKSKDGDPSILRLLTVTEIAEELEIKLISKAVTNGIARTLRKMGFKKKKTSHCTGYLMPRLYSAAEKDAMQMEHIFEDAEDPPF